MKRDKIDKDRREEIELTKTFHNRKTPFVRRRFSTSSVLFFSLLIEDMRTLGITFDNGNRRLILSYSIRFTIRFIRGLCANDYLIGSKSRLNLINSSR